MQFLRTLFWALLVGILVAFAFNNWTSVDVRLWGGMVAQTNLPLLLGIVFLLGFLPMFLAHQAMKWRLKSKLASTERALNELRNAQTPIMPPPAPSVPSATAPTAAGELPLDPAPGQRL
ncbi:lipopolysaccharide assembly protein LapA domain-containing protein [Sphingomonas sp. FW199]|uniref:lipopolysaccharide assembly protein LapA domain-containing protein n=1 Tax=Sphingomonas sp. FW199 TaxID=3400217 RepID=UPI003CE688EC